MRRTAVIVALVAVLGIAALVDSLRGGGDELEPVAQTEAATGEGESLRGPAVPAPGALPGGLLVAEAGECRLRVLDFATAALGASGPPTLCQASASPAGAWAVVQSDQSGSTPAAREIALVRIGDPPTIERTLGEARGEVAWARDGTLIAWCRPGGMSVVLDLETGAEREVPGCSPRFAADGSVLTLPDRNVTTAFLGQLWRDGEIELDADDLARGFDPGSSGPISVLEYDVSADGVIALVASRLVPTGTESVLELWRDGQLEGRVALPRRYGSGSRRLGELLRFGPRGRELAIGFSRGRGELSIVDLGLERLVLRAVEQQAFAWSPDGAWLALAVNGEIRVYGAVRNDPVYVLPVNTELLAWVPGEKPPTES